MPSFRELTAALRRVRSLHFVASSEAHTGWDGVGVGTVTVSEPAADVVVFDEVGTWQPSRPGCAALAFTNVLRWSALGGVLRLEHLRFGVEHPVLLFDLAPDEDGVWRVVSPHQCRDDCYTATLADDGGRLLLTWSIVGPRKCETIQYTYE